MLTDTTADGSTASRTSSMRRLLFRDGSPTPIWCLPDTTYLERWDCNLAARPPIHATPDGAADSDPPAVVAPERACAVPGRADRSRRAARPDRPDQARRHGALSGRLSRLSGQIKSAARANRLAGPVGGGADGEAKGFRGAPNPNRSVERYVENQLLLAPRAAARATLFQARQPRLSGVRGRDGFIGKHEPIVLQLYSEPLQRFRLAAEGHGAVCSRPARERERVQRYFDPLPMWYPPFEGAGIEVGAFPPARDHAAADGDCIIRGIRRMPGCARSTAPTGST